MNDSTTAILGTLTILKLIDRQDNKQRTNTIIPLSQLHISNNLQGQTIRHRSFFSNLTILKLTNRQDHIQHLERDIEESNDTVND